MIDRIAEFCTKNRLVEPNSAVIIGLSGGPDSVFLLHAMATLRQELAITTLVAAHLDHEWRANSAADVTVCRSLAQQYNVMFEAGSLSSLALSNKTSESKEAVGRRARRTFFEQLATKYQATSIALGHHEDDQQETFLLRLLRGASLQGLIGMRPRHGLYIRPLLTVSKSEIVEYLTNHGINYLVDPTNSSDDFLRNRIRHHALPALRQCDTRFDRSFARTLLSLQETEDFLDQHTQSAFNSIRITTHGSSAIDCARFMALHRAVQKRMLIYWFCCEQVPFPASSGFLDEVLKFVHGGGHTHQIHAAWKLVKQNGSLKIHRTTPAQ